MSLTEKEIYDLNNRNVASQNVSLGNILSNKSGGALTEKQIYDLNNDNVITQKLKFGEIVNAIATGNAGSLEDLTDEEQEALNNIDTSFKNALVGDYVQIIIDEGGGGGGEQPLSARLFNFSNGIIRGFSAEGKQLYENGELTDLFLPNSYSIDSQTEESLVINRDNVWAWYGGTLDYDYPFWYEYNGVTYTSNQPHDEAFNYLFELVHSNPPDPMNPLSITIHWTQSIYKDGNDYMVTSVGANAFLDKPLLTSLTSNNPNLVSLGSNAFNNCPGLTTVDLSGCIADYFTIGSGCFAGSSINDLQLPAKISSIAERAFGSTQLESIVIPQTVTSIDATAFIGCTRLTSLTVEAGNSTFDSRDNCNAIIETTTNKLVLGCITTVIPNTVSIIGEQAFADIAFTSIEIPSSVSTIEHYAFGGTGLTSITIPSTVDSVGDNCFIGCQNLTTVNIQNPDIQAGGDVFGNCYSLTTVNYAGTKLQWDTLPFKDEFTYFTQQITVHCIDGDIEYNAPVGNMVVTFSSTLHLEPLEVPVPAAITKTLAQYVVEYIGGEEYLDRVRTVTFPEGVETIGESFAVDCTGLNSVTFPSTLRIIQGWAFARTNLASIDLPASIERISDEAFANLNRAGGNVTVTCRAPIPPYLGYGALDVGSNATLTDVFVQSASVSAYQQDTNWSQYASIISAIV